eukprot:gene27408-4702_t
MKHFIITEQFAWMLAPQNQHPCHRLSSEDCDMVMVMPSGPLTMLQPCTQDFQTIAATPMDCELRFKARALWPSFAARLRNLGSAVPVVVGLVVGGESEATLSEEYGGKAGEEPGPADAIYVSLGKVLTISGRTIRADAQATPVAAKEAAEAISALLPEAGPVAAKEAAEAISALLARVPASSA